MSTCRIFLLTYHNIMPHFQIIISTYQEKIITTSRLISWFCFSLLMPLSAIYLSNYYLTSKHIFCQVDIIIYSLLFKQICSLVNLSDNDVDSSDLYVDLSDLYVDLSNVMATCQIILLLSV